MSIFHKILVALIFLTIPFNFFFACRALKTHQIWREKINTLEKQIAQLDEECYTLEYGVINEKTGEVTTKGILQLVAELDSIMFQRGRAWFNATAKINPETGVVFLEVLDPAPHNIVEGTILYCFESKPLNLAGQHEQDDEQLDRSRLTDVGGHYIGKFTVKNAEDTKIELYPSMDMELADSNDGQPNNDSLQPNEHLMNKLNKVSNTWTLYEKMPKDEHSMYVQMDEDRLRELMPKASVEEFIKDGKDDPDRQGMKYERQLRDYERIFDTISIKEVKLKDLLTAASFDAKYAQSALEDAKAWETAQKNLKQQLADQLATVKSERAAIATHLKRVEARYNLYVNKIKQVRAENIKLAKQIDSYQREAAKRIYARAKASGVASAL